MGAESIKKTLRETYEAAQRELAAFRQAAGKKDYNAAGHALQLAAAAICAGLRAAENDSAFWAEMANLLKNSAEVEGAVKQALADIDSTMAKEGDLLQENGYSPESVDEHLRDLALLLKAFRKAPTGETLELARRNLSRVRQIMCQLSLKPIEIAEKGFWGRAYRLVKIGVKTLAGASAICFDLMIDPTIALGIVSVSAGVDLLIGVGDEIGRE